MRVERESPTVFRLTLHTLELSALIAAARWVVEGAEGELPVEARSQLHQVLKHYDSEISRGRRSEET